MLPDAERPDVMVIAIPAYDVAYRFAQFAIANGIPYVIDARDKWPDCSLILMCRSCKRLVILRFIDGYDAYAIRNADAHVAMSRDMADWLEGYLGEKTVRYSRYTVRF